MSKKNVEWEWKKLGDLYPISMGKTPPRADKSCWDPKKETNNVWVSIADISANENSVIYDTKEYISNKAAKNITKVEKDSLLLSFKLTIGKMAFAGAPLYTNEAIVNFPPKKGLSLAYLHKYFLYYDWEKSCEGDTKVKGKTLNKEKLKNIDVLLPPLDEQERIVKVLDDAFKKIDTIKTTAETNLQNAKDLFQTTLAQELTITDEKIKQGWKTFLFNEIFSLKSGDNLPTNKLKNGSFPVYGGNGIAGFHAEYNLDGDNILIGRVGALCGNVRNVKGKVWVTDNCFKLMYKDAILPLNAYVTYELSFANLRSYAKQAAQPVISNVALRDVVVTLPPLPIQKQIVAKLDSLSEKVKQLESNYKQILADCDELKKALLKQAFEGML